MQDYIELIALGKKGQTGEVTDPLTVPKYEVTAEEGNQTLLSFVHLLKSHTVMSPSEKTLNDSSCSVQTQQLVIGIFYLPRCFVSVPRDPCWNTTHPTRIQILNTQ